MSVKLKVFKNMIGLDGGEILPTIEYSDPNAPEFERYSKAVKGFEKTFEVEETIFDWDADLGTYRLMMSVANDIDTGRMKADQLPENYQRNLLQMRAMAKMMGSTMPGVSLEIRTKGTDWHHPLQILFADHVQNPRERRITLTKFELETLTLGLEKQIERDDIKRWGSDGDVEEGGDKE